MKKSIVMMFGVALAAAAFAQGPACDGRKCGPKPQCPREMKDCRPQPVVLFLGEQVDDAAVEAYKQAVLAQIDEAVAKSRAPMPEAKKCGCEKCECEQCACEKKEMRRPPLKLEFSVSCRPPCFKGERPDFGKCRGERPRFHKGERPCRERCQGEGCEMPPPPPAPEAQEAAPEAEL